MVCDTFGKRAGVRMVKGWQDKSVKLLVAALEIELDAFPASIEGFDRLVTGAGKLKAALGLTRALERGIYDQILVLGTAGSVGGKLPLGIYDIAEAIQWDVADLDGVAGQSMVVPNRVATGREGITIATGDKFVQAASESAVIESLGGSMVDMETYVYIWVAQQYDVPIRVVKAVSDSAEDGAIFDWRTRVTECSADLWQWFQKELLPG